MVSEKAAPGDAYKGNRESLRPRGKCRKEKGCAGKKGEPVQRGAEGQIERTEEKENYPGKAGREQNLEGRGKLGKQRPEFGTLKRGRKRDIC